MPRPRRDEIAAELVGTLVAAFAILDQGVQGDVVIAARDVGVEGRGRLRRLTDVLVGDRDRRVAREGGPAGEQLEEKATGGVEVGPGVDGLALGLLGREVLRRADHGLGLGHRRRGVGDGPGDAEVHDLDLATAGQHDVGRLDVPVDDAHPVAVGQGGEHPLGDPGGFRRGDDPLPVQLVAQRLALDDLHHDVGQRHGGATRIGGRVLTGVIDRDDRRVVQPGSRLRLAAEPGEEVRVPGEVGAQHLDRDRATQTGVMAEVHLGHAAAADELGDLVAAAEQTGGGHPPTPRAVSGAVVMLPLRRGVLRSGGRRPVGHGERDLPVEGERAGRADLGHRAGWLLAGDVLGVDVLEAERT